MRECEDFWDGSKCVLVTGLQIKVVESGAPCDNETSSFEKQQNIENKYRKIMSTHKRLGKILMDLRMGKKIVEVIRETSKLGMVGEYWARSYGGLSSHWENAIRYMCRDYDEK